MSNQEFVEHTCGECGIVFCMTAERCRQLHRTGEDFYCPNGHCRAFTNTDAQKIAALTNSRDYFEDLAQRKQGRIERLERQLNSYRGHAKRRRKLQRKPVKPEIRSRELAMLYLRKQTGAERRDPAIYCGE